MRHHNTKVARRTGAWALGIAMSVSQISLVACSSPDVHDSDAPKDEWTVTNTSENLDTQVIVHNETGIEYIAIILDDEGQSVYGFCERYDSDGNIMHDGDPTKGGKFGFEFISETEDSSGLTKVFRDRQTGVAYRWHQWSNKGDRVGQGLSVCRDRNGRIQRWDDDTFISVPVADDADGDGDTSVTGTRTNSGKDAEA